MSQAYLTVMAVTAILAALAALVNTIYNAGYRQALTDTKHSQRMQAIQDAYDLHISLITQD